MAIIKCKMCGGDIELSPDKTFGTCDSCGSTMTFPKVDDEQRAAAFNRGNYFRRIGEFDKALALYERIVQEDETDAEAHWCCALCRYGIEYVEDPATYEWIPTCHRASFDSILKDVDYLAALEYSDGVTRRQYQRDAAKIAEVQRGILATSQNEEPFDVFLCYKETDAEGNRTRDSLIAQDIYYQLTQQGRRVFFARITLEDKAGAQYEPYIFAALHSAKVMIVVGTSAENFSAVWVKNEWSRFLALMRKDRSKLLLPCYRDMDPYDLPEQLAVLQSYDMSKIGFLQDLLHGVAKVLDVDKKPEPIHERVIVQSEGNTNVTALLKRGEMAIEDGDWTAAEEFYDRVLDMDAECAEAYVGKFLISVQQKTLEDFALSIIARLEKEEKPELLEATFEDEAHIASIVRRFAIPYFLDESEIRKQYEHPQSYPSTMSYWTVKIAESKKLLTENRNLQRARSFAKGNFQQALEAEVHACEKQFDACIEQAKMLDAQAAEKVCREYAEMLSTADHSVSELHQEAEKRREETYSELCKKQEDARTSAEFLSVAEQFGRLAGYQDAKERKIFCEKRADEALRREKRTRKRKQKRIVALVTVVASFSVILVVSYILGKPLFDTWNNLRIAQNMAKAGNFEEAEVYYRASGSDDAEERIQEMYYEAAKNLENEGNIIDAVWRYTQADGYADSLQRMEELQNSLNLQRAEKLAQDGKYDAAAIAYRESGIANPEERIDEMYYNAAQKSEATGDARQAILLYDQSNGYADALDRRNELWNSVYKQRKTIAAGSDYILAIKNNGTVVFSGLFNSSYILDTAPLEGSIEISAGPSHAAGLKKDGTVVAIGENIYGQCDTMSWSNIISIDVGKNHTVGLRADGSVVAVGLNSEHQCDVGDWKDIIAVSAGDGYTVGLKKDGRIVVTEKSEMDWQSNAKKWENIVAISAGSYHVVGVNSAGNVMAVGAGNQTEEICNVDEWENVTSVAAGGNRTVGLTADNEAISTENKMIKWEDVVEISAGANFFIILREDGTVTPSSGFKEQFTSWNDIQLP